VLVALFAVIGIATGALVNRLAADLPARHPPRRPRCPYCGTPRPWYHWVALPAAVARRDRCPRCGAPIPLRYPLVELALGFLFGFLFLHYGLTPQFGFAAAYTAILAIITVTDLERRLILNVVTLPAMGLALIGSFFFPGLSWKSALVGGLLGYVTFYLLMVIGNATVGPGALGQGDVKLAALVGLMTGFPLVVEALILTILSGGLVSLLLVVTRVRSLRDPIPYGPFLVFGGWVTTLWGVEIARWFLS
jgi:prepilin signal peptidase PulO-like enzyme (type II secretory pathway)